MTKRTLTIASVCLVLFAGILLVNCAPTSDEGEGEAANVPGAGFAAVPGGKGGHDVFGPYDPVQKWPLPLAESLPNHEGWTWSQSTDVFAESPDRVIVAQKGELPVLPARIETTWLPQLGAGIKFPVGGNVPLREGRAGWQRRPPGHRLALGARHRRVRSQRQGDQRLVAVGQDLGPAA
jgi:hypothetical protein